MGKKFSQKSEDKPKKKRSPARNKRAGNNFEREIVKKLNEIGFDVATSRLMSKHLDDSKVDIYDKLGNMPCLIQAKYTQATPNYFEIEKACPIKTKPFTILWKKAMKEGKNSPGTVAIIPVDFFYELIKLYASGKSGNNISKSSDKGGNKN